ncbi:MAG TPA: NAD-dependent epimerase/dehydratase family protein [Polyangiaceae bacterium]
MTIFEDQPQAEREHPTILRVFVTGATGFIGLHLCRRLRERGDEVIALVRSPEKAKRLPVGTETFVGDLSVFADPGTVLPPCDVIVHLAGVVAAGSLDEYDAVNHRRVKDLVDCVRRQNFTPKRLLFASSLAAAGPSAPGKPSTEADALCPIEPYGRAKALAEPVVRAAPFPTTAFRPPIVFGPGDEATLTFFKAAKSGVGMRIAGVPQELSFVDVRDLVEAIVLMADDTRTASFVYFASHPDLMTVPEMWREVGRGLGKRVLVLPIPQFVLYAVMVLLTLLARVFRFKNQLDEKQYDQMVAPAFVCSSERLRTELGWAPRYPLSEALSNAAKGYREAGWL